MEALSLSRMILLYKICGSLLIALVEPILNMYMMNEVPTLGAIVGFTLGVIGLVCALTF